MNNRQAIHCEDKEAVLPFRTKNRIVNLLFQNRELTSTTYRGTLICFLAISLIFLALSIFFFVAVAGVVEVRQQYYSTSNSDCLLNTQCAVSFQVDKAMAAPVYLMYELGNFYQNHRRYIQSKNNYQLAGNDIDSHQAQICSPYITNADFKYSTSWNGTALDPTAIASPCGSIAYTFFNDTFALYSIDSTSLVATQIAVNETGISWSGDKGSKFKQSPNSSNLQWIDPENEHFIVWMRTSGLPNFKKLWGKVYSDLPAGSYKMVIRNNYNSTEWNGERSFFLTTKSVVGGKNYLLPTAFLVIGLISLLAAVCFWRKFHLLKKEGDSE